MFVVVNMCEEQQKGASYHVISNNRVEDFKVKYGFDNDHLEMPIVRMMDQRSHHIKSGYCDETPHNSWRKYKKGILI